MGQTRQRDGRYHPRGHGARGDSFFQRTTTNQIFAVLTEEQNAALALDFAYERWATLDDGRVAVRFVTSWATTAEDCRKLVSALEAMA